VSLSRVITSTSARQSGHQVEPAFARRIIVKLALNRGELAHAIEMLQTSAPYELAVPGIDYYFFFGGLYPVSVRGEAHLAAHQSGAATAEFRNS
jgi:hypothetical protein